VQHQFRQFATALALAGALGSAACSGTSSSMNPTSPSALSSASGGSNFSPNPDETPTCETDPTLPECEVLSGRFTGGGFQFDDSGAKVTRGFTIHCDNTLTNNLEVNWGGGNNFHIDKESLTGVVCTRPVDPTPPQAGVSRIEATSPGTCNKAPATINFILEDHGEPGTNDRAQLIITGSAPGCSLNISLRTISGGNIQAHFDQPHKN